MKDSRILFVTGASSDIGFAMIDSVVDNYDTIVAHYNHSQRTNDELIQKYGEKIIPIHSDFTCEESVDMMLEAMISANMIPNHIVHLAAPKAYNLNFHKEKIENLKENMQVSVISISKIVKTFIPYMAKAKYGRIIFMLSSYVIGTPAKYQSFYTITKYALLGLMTSLANEYADKNIHVNAVSPSMVETKFLSDIPDLIIQDNANKNPVKRNLNVADVVPTFKFLLSDGANAITGVNIAVTNGVK